MKKIIVGILIFMLAFAIIITLVVPQTFFETSQPTTNIPPIDTDENPRNDIANPNPDDSEPDLSDVIVLTSPRDGATVTSPLIITGRARGNWYFEADFPIELIDLRTGLIIARGIGQAQGEWMTENFVPFRAELTFPKPATTTPAKLLLRKDNPSGLPENDASISITVTVR
jgi:hypothetical protein